MPWTKGFLSAAPADLDRAPGRGGAGKLPIVAVGWGPSFLSAGSADLDWAPGCGADKMPTAEIGWGPRFLVGTGGACVGAAGLLLRERPGVIDIGIGTGGSLPLSFLLVCAMVGLFSAASTAGGS